MYIYTSDNFKELEIISNKQIDTNKDIIKILEQFNDNIFWNYGYYKPINKPKNVNRNILIKKLLRIPLYSHSDIEPHFTFSEIKNEFQNLKNYHFIKINYNNYIWLLCLRYEYIQNSDQWWHLLFKIKSAQQVDAPEPATMNFPASQTPHRPAR